MHGNGHFEILVGSSIGFYMFVCVFHNRFERECESQHSINIDLLSVIKQRGVMKDWKVKLKFVRHVYD